MAEIPEADIYTQLARIGKALASPLRLRLLDLLEPGESDVETLATAAGAGLKNTSAQLQQLRAAHLVTPRRHGTHVYYRLAAPEVSHLLGTLQTCAETRLADLREAITHLLDPTGDLHPVTAEELHTHLQDPATLLIDVRPAADYARSHIPGAVSLPAHQLRTTLDRLPRDTRVIAYCQGPYCVLSPDLVRLLRTHHIPARSLTGGLTHWHRTGHPTHTTPPPPT